MITDPKQTERRNGMRSEECKIVMGGGYTTDKSWISLVYSAINPEEDKDLDVGLRIVMNITDMKKLMEINHDN